MALTEPIAAADLGAGLEPARAPLHRAHHVPGYIYSSPEIYRREKDEIFMKDWLCVARAEELANPGDYMAMRIMDEPIVIARDATGRLGAFANVCRHRGVEVATGQGNAEQFSCPYHGWTYDLAGNLVGAPLMGAAQGFDAATCGLTPLRLDVWQGWVFISFDPAAEPLADFVSAFAGDFGFLQQQEVRLAKKFELELDCNWKFMAENSMDHYHVNVIHPVSLGGITTPDFIYDLRRRGGFCVFYDHTPKFDGGKLWFGEKMRAIADRPESFSGAGFLAPNMQIFAYADNVEMMTYWPLGVDRVRLTVYLLFPEAAFAHPEFDARMELYGETEAEVLGEDREMVALLQKAMTSTLFRPGPMSPVEEPIHNLLNYYLTRMFGAV